jgi:hypothetical protein
VRLLRGHLVRTQSRLAHPTTDVSVAANSHR